MYNVAEYLPDLLESLTAQEPAHYDLEIIFVDDGSEDESAGLAREWLESSRFRGTVVTKSNGGVSSARNVGMAAATGEWIGFPDADDFLHPSYLRLAEAFIRSARGARSNVVGANVLRYDEETDQTQDAHALRFRFKGAAKTVDLTRSPHYIHLMVTAAFFRLSEIRAAKLQFPEGIRNSEDAIFVSHFLAGFERPTLGVIPAAIYYYRRRKLKTSAVDIAPADPRSYIDRFRDGYLPLLKSLAEGDGVPEWLGNLVLYEYRWLMMRELSHKSKASVLGAAENEEFLQTASAVLRHLQDGWILGYRVTSMSLEVRYLLLSLKGSPLPDDSVFISRLDAKKNLMQLRYYFVGDLPTEEIRVRAKPVDPYAGKVRGLPYFGQRLLAERILWVPANSWLAVDLNGQRRPLRYGGPSIPQYALTERAIWRHFREPLPATAQTTNRAPHPRSPLRDALHRGRAASRSAREAARRVVRTTERRQARQREREVRKVREAAVTRRAVRRYSGAWVFMDRLSIAQDNAEHLYRHVAANHPDINAWFVLKGDSPDFQRLRNEGFNLVEYRSFDHHLLMLNAQHVISSHLDVEFIQPIEPRYYPTRPTWRFTFLQHGVSKDDMSAWFNQKPIDLLVTATAPEHESMVRDGSAYRVTEKEVVLTGFPRHDALLAKRAARVDTQPRVVLFAPTWRDELFKPKDGWGATRELIDNFWHTDYATNWFGLLASENLLRRARAEGWELWFLPHPMLQPHVSSDALPDGVRLVRYSDGDIQQVLASANVLITDYSSLAFEAGYLNTPVVYFQFDKDDVFAGSHIYQKGYFEYERDGFGPVVTTVDDAVAAIAVLSESDEAPEPYRTRAERTFAFRDGGNAERVVQAIRDLNIPVPPV